MLSEAAISPETYNAAKHASCHVRCYLGVSHKAHTPHRGVHAVCTETGSTCSCHETEHHSSPPLPPTVQPWT